MNKKINIYKFLKKTLNIKGGKVLSVATFDYLERIYDEGFTANWRLNFKKAKNVLMY